MFTLPRQRLAQRQDLLRHVFRNAMIPADDRAFPLPFIVLLHGSLLIETCFRSTACTYEAVMKRDYPVVMHALCVHTDGLAGKLLSDISDRGRTVHPFRRPEIGRIPPALHPQCFQYGLEYKKHMQQLLSPHLPGRHSNNTSAACGASRLLAVLFALALLAPLWSNDKPLWVHYQGSYYFPIVKSYNETASAAI